MRFRIFDSQAAAIRARGLFLVLEEKGRFYIETLLLVVRLDDLTNDDACDEGDADVARVGVDDAHELAVGKGAGNDQHDDDGKDDQHGFVAFGSLGGEAVDRGPHHGCGGGVDAAHEDDGEDDADYGADQV